MQRGQDLPVWRVGTALHYLTIAKSRLMLICFVFTFTAMIATTGIVWLLSDTAARFQKLLARLRLTSYRQRSVCLWVELQLHKTTITHNAEAAPLV